MSHSHLTLEERIRIEISVSMALIPGMHRNSSKSGYRTRTADHSTRKRRAMLRHFRCMSQPEQVAWVDEQPCGHCSPEQIARRMRLDWPEDESMHISMETICRQLRCAHRRSAQQTTKRV